MQAFQYRRSAPRRHRGMTLVEILIAVIIFAIGLLGVAGLQVAGLRYTKGSQGRVVAALHAENLVDRMRANTIGVDAGDYNNPTAGTENCVLSTNSCTPAQLASWDYTQWLAGLRTALGANSTDTNVTGTVCIDNTTTTAACDNAGSVYKILITWQERTDVNSGADLATQSFILRVTP
ncbi:MAG: type IV pilus modification protein PilV [Pseudomonadota bacterium]